MILSDKDLLKELKDGDLVVDPITDLDQQIQPASIDIRLGTEFKEFIQANIPCIDPSNQNETVKYTRDFSINEDEDLILHPGDFILASTKEYFEIPRHKVATIEGRSSIGRLAVIIHTTAGYIDPGYQGKITLELSNVGRTPIALKPNMRIGQLVVSELTSPCERAYNEDRDSKYQNQTGPEESKIQNDKDIQ